ncbi:GSU2403 family nucleotidyltransferase fold protein [Bdellovibrionota bacterium FG-1]
MVAVDEQFFRAFGSLVQALEPYLSNIVFIGGVSNALYGYHPAAQPSGRRPLMTKDLDLATDRKIPVSPEAPRIAELLDGAGFKANQEVLMTYGLTKFRLDTGAASSADFEIEFLCPLVGKDRGEMAAEVQAGVSATPLRFMDLPLWDPWHLEVRRLPGLSEFGQTIQIPNPAAYLVQKFITMFRREGRTRKSAMQKDAFYIYEFCLKFRDALPLVDGEISRLIAATVYNDVRSFRADFTEHFNAETSPGVLKVLNEARTLTYDEGEMLPDAATIYGVIQRLVDLWAIEEGDEQ